MSALSVSTHQAMNTWWQIRIAGEDESYSRQAAQSAFQVTDQVESLFSRFRENSEISAIAAIPAGARLRVSHLVFDCLSLAEQIKRQTLGAFDVGFLQQAAHWHLDEDEQTFVAETSSCRLDLGAIGKGFALDRMADELRNWGCEKFLLLSSGSSILAGDAPQNSSGWAVTFGPEHGPREVQLVHQALSTSGFAMQQEHIIDPATRKASARYQRTWAVASSAAEADAFSTAWMNMEWAQIAELCGARAGLSAGALDTRNQLLLAGDFWQT